MKTYNNQQAPHPALYPIKEYMDRNAVTHVEYKESGSGWKVLLYRKDSSVPQKFTVDMTTEELNNFIVPYIRSRLL